MAGTSSAKTRFALLPGHDDKRIVFSERPRPPPGQLTETARLPGKLVGEDFDLVDGRRLGQQFAGFRHQRGGDLAVEVSAAAGLGISSIQYSKRRRAFLDREPS